MERQYLPGGKVYLLKMFTWYGGKVYLVKRERCTRLKVLHCRKVYLVERFTWGEWFTW